MSWNEIDLGNIDLITLNCQELEVSWFCPRCLYRQFTRIKIDGLISGIEIPCQNTKVCGERQAYFELCLNVNYGRYKCLSDRPLNKL